MKKRFTAVKSKRPTRQNIGSYISAEEKEKIESYCTEHEISIADLIRESITRYTKITLNKNN